MSRPAKLTPMLEQYFEMKRQAPDAILFYRLVLRKKLIGAMITGKGEAETGVEPMRRGRWWVALLCLAIAIGVTRWVIAGAPI